MENIVKPSHCQICGKKLDYHSKKRRAHSCQSLPPDATATTTPNLDRNLDRDLKIGFRANGGIPEDFFVENNEEENNEE